MRARAARALQLARVASICHMRALLSHVHSTLRHLARHARHHPGARPTPVCDCMLHCSLWLRVLWQVAYGLASGETALKQMHSLQSIVSSIGDTAKVLDGYSSSKSKSLSPPEPEASRPPEMGPPAESVTAAPARGAFTASSRAALLATQSRAALLV